MYIFGHFQKKKSSLWTFSRLGKLFRLFLFLICFLSNCFYVYIFFRFFVHCTYLLLLACHRFIVFGKYPNTGSESNYCCSNSLLFEMNEVVMVADSY
jgi:hypothetical protein